MKKKFVIFALCLAMVCTLFPKAIVNAEENEVVPSQEYDVSRSKTATELDSNNESTVTLSLPSAEEELSSDVVFVLDVSDTVGETMNQISELINQLETAVEKTGANIKVGVAVFNGSAYKMFDGKLVEVATAIETLTDMSSKATTEKEVWAYLGLDKDPDYVNKGSNLHAGLRAAQQLLDSDETVAANRKYLVNVTDGLTYYWNDEQENVYGVYSCSSLEPSLLFYAWCEANNIDSSNGYKLPEGFNWETYIDDASKKIEFDDGCNVVNVREMKTLLNTDYSSVRFPSLNQLTQNNISFIKAEEKKEHAHGIDYSVYACLETYADMVDAGYQCYTLNRNYGENTFPYLFVSKLNEMAGKTVIDFNSIEKEILYAVGAGSVVEDKMGSDFDFVTGSLKLTVGTETLASTTEGNVTYFGENASEQNYRFKVEYDETEDKLTWTINENVSNFAAVQLSYKVKLVNVNKEAGAYVTPTNEYALLKAVDSIGQKHEVALEFAVPTVTYTVKAQPSTGDYTNFALLAGFMVVSAAAIVVALNRKKKFFN